MKSTMHTTVTVDLHLTQEEAKRLNEVSQLMWNMLKGTTPAVSKTFTSLAFTDKDTVLFESLYHHTLASSNL